MATVTDPFLSSAVWQAMRARIRARDGHRCVDCGRPPGRGRRRLSVHHVIPRSERPDLALEPSNLVTLCLVCHGKRDGGRSRGGRGFFDGAAATPRRSVISLPGGETSQRASRDW